MQEDQAKAGHFVIGGIPQAPGATAAATADDPMAKLTKLKNMLDAGLITQTEYDKKKADILAAMSACCATSGIG
jgi:membrane protease subunit (stomatin/prohibitin family)